MSKIYIKVINSNIITEIHYNPFDPVHGLKMSREELEKDGYFVDSIPKMEVVPYKRAIAKYNPDSKEVYYEYITTQRSNQERVDNIEGILNVLLMANASLNQVSTLGGEENISLVKDGERSINKMSMILATYLTSQIEQENISYTEAISKYPNELENINYLLRKDGFDELIVNLE